MSHCRVQSPGEINVMIVPHCGVYEFHPPYWKSFSAVFFFVFFYFLNTVSALTSGGFRIVFDTLVSLIEEFCSSVRPSVTLRWCIKTYFLQRTVAQSFYGGVKYTCIGYVNLAIFDKIANDNVNSWIRRVNAMVSQNVDTVAKLGRGCRVVLVIQSSVWTRLLPNEASTTVSSLAPQHDVCVFCRF